MYEKGENRISSLRCYWPDSKGIPRIILPIKRRAKDAALIILVTLTVLGLFITGLIAIQSRELSLLAKLTAHTLVISCSLSYFKTLLGNPGVPP